MKKLGDILLGGKKEKEVIKMTRQTRRIKYAVGLSFIVAAMIVAFAVANVSAQVYPSGMVSYWKADGNAEDSYNSNHGTLMNGVTFATGIVGQAFSFDGVDDYVNIGNLGSFPSKGTIIYWMYPNEVVNYRNPFGTDIAGNNAGIRFEEDSTGKFEVVIAYIGYGAHTYTNSLSANNWYLVTLVWDSTSNNVKGYLNGALVFDHAQTNWPSALPDVEIGKGIGYYSDRNWNGLIDEVAIYNRALSAEEIAQHYQNGLYGLGYDVAVYDDFNGSEINSTLWRIHEWRINDNDPCHILSQSGGFLQASGPPNHCYGVVWTNQRFSGDFEFVLEYSDFQSNATVFSYNNPLISLQVNSSSNPNDFIQIFRSYAPEFHNFPSNGDFLSGGVVNGAGRASFVTVASSPSGSLKISRIGSTITTYYNEGMGWRLLGSFEGAFTEDVTLQIGAYSGDDGTFNVSCDKVYAPAAADIEFNLTISKQGTGNGRVTSDPIGVDCGGTCTAAYDIYTSVSLSAIPDAYSTFVGWSGACSGTGSCTVTMDTSKIVTANFVPKAAVYDDFNGDSIDTTLWGIGDPCHIFSQSGGFLRASGPPNHCFGFLWPIQPFVFGGDFEFVLEFSDFQSNATVSENRPGISLQVTSGGDFIYIFRGYVTEHHFTSMGFVNGAWRTGGGTVASSPSGSLKISRIGSTITTYYNEGMDWVLLGSFEGAFTEDVRLHIVVYSGDDGTFNVSCDKVYAPAAAYTGTGSITGRVTDPDGNGLANVNVSAFDPTNNWIAGTTTGSNGNYMITIAPGNYKVQFSPPMNAGPYITEWYYNTDNRDFATLVNVTSGQTTSNIDAQLKVIKRIQNCEVAIYNGDLTTFFFPYPGFRGLVQSATLTGPGVSHTFNLQTETLNMLSECRYLVGWTKNFGPINNRYGQYILSVTYFDGLVETFTENLQPPTQPPVRVNENAIQVTVNPDGSTGVRWDLPPNTNQWYSVRVRTEDGATEYYRSSSMYLQYSSNNLYGSLNISAYDLRCLEQGQNYRWLVRAYDAMNTVWGINIYTTVETSFVYAPYNTALTTQRTSYCIAQDWQGKLLLNFDVRPGSRDDIIQATVTGPNSFSYQFDLAKDYYDFSTEARFNKGWVKQFDPPIAYGNYNFQIVFSDSHTDPLTRTLQDVPITPVDPNTMNLTIYPNGWMTFQWALPSGVTNQDYAVRIRSLDGTKEYYSSPNLRDGQNLTTSFSDLRGLEHCKTYQWFVRAYDPGNNTMQQSNSQTFFYNPFNLDYRSLTVTKVGNGKVTSSLMGINCGPYCQDTFVRGVPVTLTATPDPGSTFIGWGGDCSGTDPCTVTMDAGHTVTATFDVNTPSGGPEGGIIVRPVDPVTSTTPVEITFDSVTTAGSTYLNISQNGEPPPIGFKLGEPPTYYNITTTAVYSGSIQICINYSGVSFGDESNIRLFHLEGGVWVDRTVSIDTTNKIICANVTSLSPFAIFERVDIIPPVTTAQLSPAPNATGWNNSDTQVTLSAVDNNGGLGVKNITYSASGAQSIPTTTVSGNSAIFSITAEGQTTITFFAADNANNVETAKNVTLNIDKTKPNVNITATPSTLWPPNHTMVKVTVNGSASDQLSGIAATSFKVTDEYGKVEPTISKFGDVIQLEAWRNGDDSNGRIYTISVTATDKAGNQATASTTVICPHDQGKK